MVEFLRDIVGFNPCSIGIPLMSPHVKRMHLPSHMFQSLFYWNTSDELTRTQRETVKGGSVSILVLLEYL